MGPLAGGQASPGRGTGPGGDREQQGHTTMHGAGGKVTTAGLLQGGIPDSRVKAQ